MWDDLRRLQLVQKSCVLLALRAHLLKEQIAIVNSLDLYWMSSGFDDLWYKSGA